MSQVPAHFPLDPQGAIYIAGHRGMVGGAIWRELTNRGFTNLVGATSQDLDLRDRDEVFAFFEKVKPDVVIDAAARVGGILANNTYPAEFLSDNLQIQVNIMDAANSVDVNRLLFLGSSCIYPKYAEQPIKESSLLTGALEPTNDAYAIAKIAGIMQVQASRRQYGRQTFMDRGIISTLIIPTYFQPSFVVSMKQSFQEIRKLLCGGLVPPGENSFTLRTLHEHVFFYLKTTILQKLSTLELATTFPYVNWAKLLQIRSVLREPLSKT
jgi:dTDP-4-dehydrorhamnose reductase